MSSEAERGRYEALPPARRELLNAFVRAQLEAGGGWAALVEEATDAVIARRSREEPPGAPGVAAPPLQMDAVVEEIYALCLERVTPEMRYAIFAKALDLSTS